MAGINGPKIVTSKLVRCWDAADFKYNRSSWVDLTGSGDYIYQNNGFSTGTSFGGFWSFNGSFQVVIMGKGFFPALDGGPRTLEIWMNSQQSNSADTNFRGICNIGSAEFGRGFNPALRGTTELGFNAGNWVNAGETTWQTISGGIYNRWLLFTLSYSYPTLTWYINGSYIYAQTITLSSANTVDANRIAIGSYGNFCPVWIGSIRFYQDGLSASQVLNNYNATKGRFGL
jgi:hypothetical protein